MSSFLILIVDYGVGTDADANAVLASKRIQLWSARAASDWWSLPLPFLDQDDACLRSAVVPSCRPSQTQPRSSIDAVSFSMCSSPVSPNSDLRDELKVIIPKHKRLVVSVDAVE